jgi:EamA domain-containing membrane protein RarD
VADLLALCAAFLFALAATLQQKGALATGGVSLGSPTSFVRLARQTSWLLGSLALLGGYEFWIFSAAGVLAFLVQQVSLATGQLAPSVAMTAVVNPLVCIAVGTLLLEERLAPPTWHKALAYAGLGLALAAAVAITRATETRKVAGEVTPAPAV